jgi:hypothetical protein
MAKYKQRLDEEGGSMNKIIIHYDDISDTLALEHILEVIGQGKISKNNSQYCFITRFKSGYTVFADKNKSGTNTFRIYASQA